MATSTQVNSERLKGYRLKQWAYWLAMGGLGAEILLLVLCFLVNPPPITILPHVIAIPLYAIIGSGILGSIAFLLIRRKFEQNEIEDQQMLDVQKRLFQQPALTSKGTRPLRQTGTPAFTPPSNTISPGIASPSTTVSPPVMNQPPAPPFVISLAPREPFIVPLEGDDPNECDDKAASLRNRYAVTDGVSQSFMPARWAGLIAHRFVERTDDFNTVDDCATWLQSCSLEWEQWVRDRKLPLLKKEYSWMPWDEKVEQGAQTTFIGCSLFATREHSIVVRVTSLGDAYFFLYRQVPPVNPGEQWIEMFPFENPDGGNITHTFKTLAGVEPERAKQRIWRSWSALRFPRYDARVGDIIFLVTDKLALWIWQHLMKQDESWKELLNLLDAQAFRAFVLKERATRSLALDDTTFFMIPLTKQLYQQLPQLPESATQTPPQHHI